MTNEILFERLHPDVRPPEAATAHSAGRDLRAYLLAKVVRVSDGSAMSDVKAELTDGEWSITLAPGQMALVPLGFRTRLPVGMEAQVRPRSGQVFKTALTVPNAPGTVDADFADEWHVIVRNDAPVPRRLMHGERIAQVVFAQHAMPVLREGEVVRTSDRAGGFGSTGTR